jgi:hypothetical protein
MLIKTCNINNRLGFNQRNCDCSQIKLKKLELEDLHFIELDNSALENTAFYLAFSSLSFNRGIIFKRIGTQPAFVLAEVIENIDKDVLDVVIHDHNAVGGLAVYTKAIGANIEVHDFIFDLLTHHDIDKKWRYNDDDYFTEFSVEYNSKERFREIGFSEIDIGEFGRILLSMAMRGSVYDKMKNYPKAMINEFVSSLLTGNDRIIVNTQPWGEYYIGWFTCFFVVRKADVLIFAVDDYD